MSESKPPEERPDRPMPPMPSWPDAEGDARGAAAEKPKLVRIAVILMYVGAVLSAVSILSVFGAKDQLREDAERALKQQKRPVTPDAIEALANNTLTFIIVFGLIMIALWIFLAFMNDRGKSWARLTATVLAVANVFFNLQGLSYVGLALVVVGVAAAVLLWMPASRPWFDRTRTRKISA